MNIKKSIQMRVIIALEKGQNRIRCIESENDEAMKYGITDPYDKRRFIAGFSSYEDTKGGFFAYFNEGFKRAARKAWNVNRTSSEQKSV